MWPHGLDNFYQKYTEAYGIPVLGKACSMVADLGHPDLLPVLGKVWSMVPDLGHPDLLPVLGKVWSMVADLGHPDLLKTHYLMVTISHLENITSMLISQDVSNLYFVI